MHYTLKLRSSLFPLLLVSASLIFIRSEALDVSCEGLRNGQFYYYGKQSGEHFLILRQGSLQKEVNTVTKDTSYWSVAWINDCTYTASYLSGGGMKSNEEISFLRSHITIIQVQKVTTDYYIIKGALDSLNSRMYLVDTVWMKAR